MNLNFCSHTEYNMDQVDKSLSLCTHAFPAGRLSAVVLCTVLNGMRYHHIARDVSQYFVDSFVPMEMETIMISCTREHEFVSVEKKGTYSRSFYRSVLIVSSE